MRDIDELRRDPLGIVLGSFLVITGMLMLFGLYVLGGWWWILVWIPAGILLFGTGGLAIDATKRKRNSQGQWIP